MRSSFSLRLVLVLVAAGTLCGCSLFSNSPIRLDKEVRASLATVTIAPATEGDVTYTGRLPNEYEEEKLPGLFTTVFKRGTVKKKKTQRLKSIFETSKVSVPAIVRTSFKKYLAETELFAVVEKGPADAEFSLEVGYGLTAAVGMDESYKPWLTVVGTLHDPDGKCLWRKRVHIDRSNSDLKQLPFPDPFRFPSQMRQVYRFAARRLMTEMMRSLGGLKPQSK